MTENLGVLKLVSGTDEVDLLSPPYALLDQAWAPKVATLDDNRLAGKGIYTDEVEEIIIDISGTTAEQLYTQGLDPLVALLNRADKWSKKHPVEPVLLYVQAVNSLLDEPQKCLVVGKNGSNLLDLPSSFNEFLMVYQIEDSVISFKRRGQFLGATETKTAPTTSTNPEIQTVSELTPLEIPGPTKVCFKGFTANTELLGEGYFMITSSPLNSVNGTNFGIWQYDDFTPTNFSQTADATYKAPGGNVMRIDAASNQTGSLVLSGVNANVEHLSVLVAVRNNTSGTTWRIRARSSGYTTDRTRWIVIKDTDQIPHITPMSGPLRSAAEYHTTITIEVETSASVGTLDIGYAITLPHNEDTQVIQIKPKVYSDSGFPRNFIIDPRPLTHRKGLAYVETQI